MRSLSLMANWLPVVYDDALAQMPELATSGGQREMVPVLRELPPPPALPVSLWNVTRPSKARPTAQILGVA